jgi:hypothetical protein
MVSKNVDIVAKLPPPNLIGREAFSESVSFVSGYITAFSNKPIPRVMLDDSFFMDGVFLAKQLNYIKGWM